MALYKNNYNLQRFLSPEKEPPVLIGLVAELAPEPVSTLWKRETSCPCPVSNPGRPARSLSRHHRHGSDENGVYSSSHLFFTWIWSLIASIMRACSLTTSSFCKSGCISASRPDGFTPRERAPCTHWIGGLVGPRSSLDTVEKRNICPCREPNPGYPACSPSRRHGHRSDKNGVYPTSQLLFTLILSLFASFMRACS
jgi:hypothetical protein